MPHKAKRMNAGAGAKKIASWSEPTDTPAVVRSKRIDKDAKGVADDLLGGEMRARGMTKRDVIMLLIKKRRESGIVFGMPMPAPVRDAERRDD